MSYQSQYETYRLIDDVLLSRTFYRDFTGLRVLNPGLATSPQITFTRSTSATRINENGAVELVGIDVPRFDFDPTTLVCRGLLIEESRANTMTNSGFDTWSGTPSSPTGWVNDAGAWTQDVGVAGVGFSARLQNNSATNPARSLGNNNFSIIAGTTYTMSAWFKLNAPGTGNIGFAIDMVSANAAIFPVSAMTVGQWVRLSSTFTPGTTVSSGRFHTNGAVLDISIDNVQMEVGSFASSYIPTTSATVTRAADVATITGAGFSSMFNPIQGTLITEGILTNTIGSRRLATFGGSGIGVGPRTNGTISSIIWRTPSNFDVQTGNVSIGNIKQALAYSNNTLWGVTNAGTIGTNTPTTPLNVAYLNVGASDAGFDHWNGPVSKIAFYNKRLPEQLLRTLTLP